ncbi:MAG: ABC transporter substrate-binding protein [Pseudomonadota bacterium]
MAACAPVDTRRNDLRVGVTLEPQHLDPTSGAAAAIDEVVYANVFEGLTRVDASGAIVPALAHAWEADAGRRSYLFHLHPGVRFHDGAPCDASAVKFSLERAMAPDSTNAQKNLFEPIAAVDVLDPTRVRIALKRTFESLPENLSWGDAVIVSPATAAQNTVHPVGTGPFRFARWARGAMIQLERAPFYWGRPAALDGVSFNFIADPASAMAALMSGDVDGFPDFAAPELLPLVRRDGRFRVAIGASQGETIVAINNARAPFSDLRVRRALSHAIDRNAVIAGAMSGYGVPIGSHFPPSDPAYIDLTGLYPYDPAEARTLLAQAGFANGFTTTLKLPPTAYARRGGEIVAAQLREVGVTARIENIEWAQWLSEVFGDKNYDLTIVSHTEPRDYDIYGRDDYYFGYHSAAFKALLTQLDAAPNAEARTALLQAIQRKIAEDAVNVFLFEFPKIGVWRKEVQGVWVDAPVQANDMTQAHWARA